MVKCRLIGNRLSIIELRMGNAGLIGTIPPEIGVFENLEFLELQSNSLNGTVPLEIFQLKKLLWLYLQINNLAGTIPREISQLSNLTRLSLSSNQFIGTIPKEISQLTKLERLFLNSNLFIGTIPPEIYQLKNLWGLYLHLNQLNGSISSNIGNLDSLNRLYFDGNKLSGTIPKELFNLTKIDRLSLRSNHLSGTIPREISQLKRLEWLYLQFNQLSGTIPQELYNITSLRIVVLHGNRLTGTISPEISQLSQLNTLHLDQNELSGSIPHELSQLVSLNSLSLSINKLTGTIPETISLLENLNMLYLNHNRLIGTIPTEIYQLSHLKQLLLNNNYLNGTMPIELFQVINLEILQLSHNELVGTIPIEVSFLKKLSAIRISHNKLSGTIPIQLYELSNLKQVHLDFNRLEGTISHNVHQLTNLNDFSIAANEFTGSIPAEISQLINMEKLDISFNEISGSLPVSLAYLNKLTLLDISHNKLTGSIPYEWNDDYCECWNLNLKQNRESPFFRELRQFKACCNEFSGSLRDFINPVLSIRNLLHIDFSYNHISGSFEFWTNKWFEYVVDGFIHQGLSSIILLDLSSNKIQDKLPLELPETLSLFFIPDNLLDGHIPDTYSQLFIFLSSGNLLRNDRLPSFFVPLHEWASTDILDESGIGCLEFWTNDGSAKIFDIQPVYDHFSRCECKPGYFNFQSSSSLTYAFAICDESPPGYFTSTRNRLTQPIPCPLGFFSRQFASTQCEICTSNTFSLGAQASCSPCLVNAECKDGIIQLKSNKWMNPTKTLDRNTTEADIYDCLNNEACIVIETGMRCAQELGYDSSSVLCSECLNGYYSSDRLKKTCDECTITTKTMLFVIFIVVLGLGIILAIHQTLVVYRSQRSSFSTKPKIKRHNAVEKECLLRIVIDHAQVLLILSDLQMRGPQLFHIIISSSVGAFIPTVSPSALQCAFQVNFFTSIVIAVLTPLVILVLTVVLVALTGVLMGIHIRAIVQFVFTVFVLLFYLIHPPLMKQLYQAFQFYHKDIEGKRYLQSDMSIERYSSEYFMMFLVALIGIILYGIVAPLCAALSLKKRANSIDPQGINKLEDPIFEQKYGFLYLGYKMTGGLYLWELIIYFRKSVLLLLGVFLGYDGFLQSYLASIVLIAALITHNKFEPYRSDWLNRAELHSLGILGVTQMCMLLSSHYGTDETNVRDLLISFLLILFNGYFFFNSIHKMIGNFCGKLFCKKKDQIHPQKEKQTQSVDWSLALFQGEKVVELMKQLNHTDLADIEFEDHLNKLLAHSSAYLKELHKSCVDEWETRSCSYEHTKLVDKSDVADNKTHEHRTPEFEKDSKSHLSVGRVEQFSYNNAADDDVIDFISIASLLQNFWCKIQAIQMQRPVQTGLMNMSDSKLSMKASNRSTSHDIDKEHSVIFHPTSKILEIKHLEIKHDSHDKKDPT